MEIDTANRQKESKKLILTVPETYRANIASESAQSIQAIKQGLTSTASAGDLYKGCNYYIRSLNKHLKLKFPTSDEDAAFIAQKLFQIVTLPDLDISFQSKWAKTLATFLRKFKDMKIVLPWRPLYHIIKETHFRSQNQGEYSGFASAKYHLASMLSLVRSARRFFSKEATEEVIKEFLPLACIHENTMFKSMAFLSTFIPIHKESKFNFQEWLPHFFAVWGWIENNEDWDKIHFGVLSRIASSQMLGKIHWEPYIPIMFSKYIASLELALGNANLPRPRSRSFSSELHHFVPYHSMTHFFAKTIVNIINPKNSAFQTLKQTMETLESFYHPSNSGRWTDDLALILVNFTYLYNHRVSKEKKVDSKVPVEFRLTKENNEQFVDMMYPAVLQGIYGKSSSMSRYSRESLKHLIHLEPKRVFPKLMERVYTAFESVTATHQSESVMEILGTVIDLIIQRSYPEGVEHLQALLEHSLNAINPNDSDKTQAAFKIYFRFLSTVPLIVSKGGDDMDTDQYDDVAKSMTALFSDWAFAFLEKIFTLLSSKDKGEKSPSGEWWMARLMEQTFTLFFQQMSDELYESTLSKIHRHVTSITNVNALVEYGLIISAAGRAQPKKALQLFIPSLYNSLVTDKGGVSKLLELSSNELKWKLTILSEVIHFGGSSLIPYKEKLLNLVLLGSASEEKAVCRASAKILRNFLMAMSDTYPADMRSLPPSQWKNPKTQFHKTWGQEFSYESAEIQWHVPSKEELQVTYEVCNKIVEWATKKCNDAINNPNVKDDYWKALLFLKQTIVGAAAVLPSLPDDQNKEDRYQEISISSGLDPKTLDYTIRKRIGELAHQLVEFFVAKRPDDISSMKAVIKVLVFYFSFHGVDMETIEYGKSYHWMIKEKYKNFLNSAHTQYRCMKITSAYHYHLNRINQFNFGLPLNTLNRQLLGDLWTLSTHSYSQVRTKAQGALIKAFRHVPKAMGEMLPTIISTLSQKTEKNGVIKGGIYILSSTTVQRKIVRDWRLLSMFLQNICRSFVHEEPSDQARLYQLFVSFALAYYKRPLATSTSTVVPDASVPQDVVLAGINQLNKDNETNIKHYQNTVLSLLQILKENPNLHWRYLVIVSTCLLYLIRRDHTIHEDIARWFLRCLNNDLAPLRLLSTKAVAMILYNNKPTLNKRQKSVTTERLSIEKLFELKPIASEEEWQKTEFFDKNSLGWNGPIDLRNPVSITKVDNNGSRTVLQEAFSNASFVEKFLKLTAVDRHNQVHQGRQGNASNLSGFLGAVGGMFGKWSKMAEGYMGRGGAMGAMKDVEEQAAAEILGELMRSRRNWPYTKTPKLSVAFNEFGAHFWKTVFQVCGFKLTEVMKPVILQAVKLEEAEGQCVVAEIVAGMIRAGKAWSFEENKAMWQYIIPLLDKALSGSGTETLPEWTTCFRFLSFNSDPRRLQPLIEYLFANPFAGATSSTIVKKLNLIKSLLNEFTWRNGKLDVLLLKLITEQLSHPFKQVRHSMGECLATIFANLWDTPRGANDLPVSYHESRPNEYLNQFIDHVTQKLESWEQFGTNELSVDQKNERSHIRETILHWISYSLTFSESFAVLSYLPRLMKYVFSMQRDPDDDIAKQAMQIPALIAQVQMPPSVLPGVLQSLLEVSKNVNWHIRSASLPFLQILVFSNKYELSQQQVKDVLEFIIRNLADPQIEIRELAKIALTSAVISTNTDAAVLADRFIKWADSLPLSKKKAEVPENVIQQRHGAIFGLCSLILSCPYDVPQWMPELLVKLSTYINDPVPIKNTVKDTFSEFWRTHQDMWPFLKSKFNEDQLYTINELVLSPNYYV